MKEKEKVLAALGILGATIAIIMDYITFFDYVNLIVAFLLLGLSQFLSGLKPFKTDKGKNKKITALQIALAIYVAIIIIARIV